MILKYFEAVVVVVILNDDDSGSRHLGIYRLDDGLASHGDHGGSANSH